MIQVRTECNQIELVYAIKFMPPKVVKSSSKRPLATKGTKKKASTTSRQDHADLNNSLSEAEAADTVLRSDDEYIHEGSNAILDTGAALPAQLLARLMHEHFVHKNETKIEKEAMEIFRRYIETFIMEAVARAAKENTGTGFLEVSLVM